MVKNTRKFVPPGLTYIAGNITSRDNILGLPREAKAKWASGLKFSSNRSTIFFAGCGYQYSALLEPLVSLVKAADRMVLNPDLPVALAGIPRKLGIDVAGLYSKVAARDGSGDSGVLRDAVLVLQQLGQEIGYLGNDEPCCGAPMYHTGLQKEFGANSEIAYSKLKAAGVRMVIGIVPSCTHALKNVFPKFINGYDITIRHFIEVAAENMKKGQFRLPHKVKVAYHDPCQLGRYMGLFEQPRHVLNSIGNVELVEPEWTAGEWSTCCGGGGGFEVVFPEIAGTLAKGRVKELAETGADIIATQCPGCLMQLKEGLRHFKDRKIEVMDLATLLAKAIPK
jgi:Fe-S oxidoreductase